MASEKSLILRNAAARERLNKAFATIRKSGVEIPEAQVTHRDAAVAKVQELEYFADTVDTLAGAIVAAKAKKSEAAKSAAAEPAKTETVKTETAKAEPAKAETTKAKK